MKIALAIIISAAFLTPAFADEGELPTCAMEKSAFTDAKTEFDKAVLPYTNCKFPMTGTCVVTAKKSRNTFMKLIETFEDLDKCQTQVTGK